MMMWCLDPPRRLEFQSSSCRVYAWRNTLGQSHQQTLLFFPQERLCFIFPASSKTTQATQRQETSLESFPFVVDFGHVCPSWLPNTPTYKSKKHWIKWLYHPHSRTSRFSFKKNYYSFFFQQRKKCTDNCYIQTSVIDTPWYTYSCGFRTTWWETLPLTSVIYLLNQTCTLPSLLLKRELQLAQIFYSQQDHRGL